MADTFGGFVEFGRHIMQGVRVADPDAVRYKWLLGEISALFAATHGIVLEKLEAVETADAAKDASTHIKELRGQALANSFHALGLCDAFAGLGQALSNLNWRIHNKKGADGESASRDVLLAHADDFARRLQEREYEVALMYADQISYLSELADSDDDSFLQDMKARAASAKRRLTIQMADFAQLAHDFKSVDPTRNV